MKSNKVLKRNRCIATSEANRLRNRNKAQARATKQAKGRAGFVGFIPGLPLVPVLDLLGLGGPERVRAVSLVRHDPTTPAARQAAFTSAVAAAFEVAGAL